MTLALFLAGTGLAGAQSLDKNYFAPLQLGSISGSVDSMIGPHYCRLANHRKLRMIVANKLVLDWLPEQISGWLKRRYPSNESMRVSHETIYRSMFI